MSYLTARNFEVDLSNGEIDFRFHQLQSTPLPLTRARKESSNPSVSCLMVTRGDIDLMRYSVECYRRQTYKNKRLVVVTHGMHGQAVEQMMMSAGIEGFDIYEADASVSLGELRNISVARARGDILVQWDDDDLYDPLRIEVCVSVLLRSRAVAVFLSRFLLWWPDRSLVAVSSRRLWEGSMAIWREYAVTYPHESRGEDTSFVDSLLDKYLVAEIDAPLHYVYAITGKNTWHLEHFENTVKIADHIFSGVDFSEFNSILSKRLPVLEYLNYLMRK